MSTSRSIEYIDFHTGKLRVIWTSLLVITSIYLLALLLSTIQVSPVMEVSKKEPVVASSSDNAVTAGMATAGVKLQQSLDTTGVAFNNGLRSFELGAVQTAKFIVHTVTTGVSTIQQGTATVIGGVGSDIGNGFAFISRIPGTIIGTISRVPSVGAIVTPATTSSSIAPAIGPGPAILATVPAVATNNAAVASVVPATTEAVWPITGRITTQFGVPHWPYQPVHTGIDISDGNRSGVTPIKPFKPGRVAEVVNSGYGLGNHVVVDHGGGLSSVYAHLNSISVQVGQQVDRQSQLGFEGSTGASTGTHLHFEIRVNGQAVDPHQYISGQPY